MGPPITGLGLQFQILANSLNSIQVLTNHLRRSAGGVSPVMIGNGIFCLLKNVLPAKWTATTKAPSQSRYQSAAAAEARNLLSSHLMKSIDFEHP